MQKISVYAIMFYLIHLIKLITFGRGQNIDACIDHTIDTNHIFMSLMHALCTSVPKLQYKNYLQLTFIGMFIFLL